MFWKYTKLYCIVKWTVTMSWFLYELLVKTVFYNRRVLILLLLTQSICAVTHFRHPFQTIPVFIRQVIECTHSRPTLQSTFPHHPLFPQELNIFVGCPIRVHIKYNSQYTLADSNLLLNAYWCLIDGQSGSLKNRRGLLMYWIWIRLQGNSWKIHLWEIYYKGFWRWCVTLINIKLPEA
jgi:hypothetical protein